MLMQTFEQELLRLQNEVLALGGMVERSVVESVDVLKRRDLAGAQRLTSLDQRIRKKRFAIEMDCLTLIVTQQPLDGDLRAISSMLEIVSELERMGDYSRDITRTPFMIIDGPLLNLLVDIHRMALTAQRMLGGALQAFVQRDMALAQTVLAKDGEIDILYTRVHRDLLAFIRDNSQAKGNSRVLVSQARYLVRIARNLERAADQVTHICEWVAFVVTGEMADVEPEPIPVSPNYAAGHPEAQGSSQESVLYC